MTKTLIAMAEYARRKGLHPTTIRDRIDRGIISEAAIERGADGKIKSIHMELADAELIQKQDLQNTFVATNKMRKKILSNVVVAPVAKPIHSLEKVEGQEDLVPVVKLPEMDSDMSRYQKAKASSEELKARKLEIEMEEMEGRLIDKQEVIKTVSKLTAEIKETLLNVPAKIAAELLACKDIVELEVKLHKEINLALEGLSRLQNKYNE